MTTIIAPPLTHRFTALYNDGTTFEQPANDTSTTRQDGLGSAFSDVKIEDVAVFFLESGGDNDPSKHMYQVDLRNGAFEIDGVQFAIGPDTTIPDGARRQLLYFRRVAHDKTTDMSTGVVARSIRRCYHIGYTIVDARGKMIDQLTLEVGHEIFR